MKNFKFVSFRFSVFFLAFFLAIFSAESLRAEPEKASGNEQSTRAMSPDVHEAKPDNWFFYFGVGIVPQPKFDSGIQSNIDNSKQNNSWAGDYGGVLELPGLYYRVGQSTMLGVLTNFIFENYARDYKDRKSLGFDTYNVSLSAMTSTGSQPGLGYFARLDFGPCDLIQVDETPGNYARSYFPGLFEQVALGYGFQSSLNTRLLSHLNFFYEDVLGHYQTGISLNIGFLL
jgi:hypothetical protein